MSAPDVNIKKQKKRHKGPLWGFAIGLSLVAVLFVIYFAGLIGPDVGGVRGLVDEDAAVPSDQAAPEVIEDPAPATAPATVQE